MQTYTTIFIDIDNITYELYSHRHMHRYSREMVEQIVKKGLKSLQVFEVIALLGKNEKHGKSYILNNHLEYMKMISKETLGFNKGHGAYLEYLLKYFNRNKKEVLVVSGNPNILNTAKLLGIDTCYFNIFSPNTLETKTDITINKLEELRKYRSIKRQSKEIYTVSEDISTNYHYYIDSRLLKILEEKNITLHEYDDDKEVFLNRQLIEKVPFAITMDLALAKFFKGQGCITYFINNHKNDNVDYVADYESSIENLPKQLERIIHK